MKRLLPTIPIILFLLLNACGAVPDPSSKVPGNWTEVIQSLTATAWTPTPTQTYNPNISNIINTMNADVVVTQSLEYTLDAEYHIDNIAFTMIPNSSDIFFRVDVRCECVKSDKCCHPERTFIVIVDSLQRNRIMIPNQIPRDVTQLLVVCLDFRTKAQIGALKAPWQDVKAYLDGFLTGYQLGVRTERITVP